MVKAKSDYQLVLFFFMLGLIESNYRLMKLQEKKKSNVNIEKFEKEIIKLGQKILIKTAG